jgi:hypothetical protein
MADQRGMDTQVVINQTNSKSRKAVAKNRLNNNELAEAVRIYAELLRDDPEDIDSLITLGNLYLAVGDGKSARSLYKRAQDKEPNNRVVQCQIQLTSGEACQGDPTIPATHPAAISNLIKELTGVQQESEDQELSRAAKMLENIIRSDNPAEQVADHMEEIDRLLPALVEINIRQAWADGRPELVESLQMVKQSILSQINLEETQTAQLVETASKSPRTSLPKVSARVLILKDANGGLSERMSLVEASLGTLGCEVYAHTEFNPNKDPLPDVAIVNNPHVSAKVLESLAALSASQVPVIVDLDNNFEQMPVAHPSYDTAGLGTLPRYKAFNTAMVLADMITVNSEALASSLSSKDYNVRTIPDGWISENHFWHDSNGQRNTINLGWISKTGQLEDLALIRRVVTRIIREFSNTQILVIGDSQAYRLFESLPENRRNYLPLLSSLEYPYQLGQVDVLLVPLRNDPYHQSISDKMLVEASAKGIPWIASPNLAFIKWQAGGLIANTQEEWYVYLRQMVMNADIRQNFAQAGRIAAKSREASRVGEHWLQAIQDLIKAKRVSSI